MEKINLEDLNILDIGNTIQLSGAVFSGSGRHFVCFFPKDYEEDAEPSLLCLSDHEWDKVVKQTDMLETEVLTKASDGTLAKIILRKSTRQIEQGISWKVFKRDGYACRYCGKDDLPLTVDHVVLWEKMGPTIEANLVSACKKCNKTRGNTEYANWLKSDYYNKVSRNLEQSVKDLNMSLLSRLDTIPLRVNVKSR